MLRQRLQLHVHLEGLKEPVDQRRADPELAKVVQHVQALRKLALCVSPYLRPGRLTLYEEEDETVEEGEGTSR